MLRKLGIAIFSLSLVLAFSLPAVAGPKGKGKDRKALNFAKHAVRWEKRLSKALSSADVATIRAIASKYAAEVNSDDDSLPDFLEAALGSSSCKSDSDDDGISDDDELDERPGEVEVKGDISAISDASIAIGDKEFAINDSTRFLGEHKSRLSLAELEVGFCVEIKGARLDDTSLVASIVKLESINGCDSDDDDHDEEEHS